MHFNEPYYVNTLFDIVFHTLYAQLDERIDGDDDDADDDVGGVGGAGASDDAIVCGERCSRARVRKNGPTAQCFLAINLPTEQSTVVQQHKKRPTSYGKRQKKRDETQELFDDGCETRRLFPALATSLSISRSLSRTGVNRSTVDFTRHSTHTHTPSREEDAFISQCGL